MALFNNTTFEGCYVPPTNPNAEWAKVATYIVLLIASVIGNFIVIRVFTTGPRMRTEVNFLIINVAVADVLVAIVNMPMMVRYFVRSANGLPPVWFGGTLGQFWCKCDSFVSGISQICCILSMTAIAFNRYIAIMFPLKSSLNANKTKLVILLIWFSSCAITSPTLYSMRVKKVYEEYHCLEDWTPAFDNIKTPKYYTLALFILMYAIPLTLIIYLYSCVIHKVWIRHVPGNFTQANQRLEDVSKRRVLKMLITVVIAFAVCWLPFHIYLMMVNFYYGINSCDISPTVLFVGLLLGHSNSAVNPWIYFIFNKDYRRNFKDLCRFPCGKHTYKHMPAVTATRCSTIKSTNGQLSGNVELTELKNTIESSS